MNNEEAANIIDHLGIKQVYDDTVSATEIGEALTLAISALENIDRITAERDASVAELKDFKSAFEEQVYKNKGIYHCDICKYGGDYYSSDSFGSNCPKDCDGFNHWEWRGAKDDD